MPRRRRRSYYTYENYGNDYAVDEYLTSGRRREAVSLSTAAQREARELEREWAEVAAEKARQKEAHDVTSAIIAAEKTRHKGLKGLKGLKGKGRGCQMKVWNTNVRVVSKGISRGLPTVQVLSCTEEGAKREALREYRRRQEFKRLLAQRGRKLYWAVGELGTHRGVNRYAAHAPGPWW